MNILLVGSGGREHALSWQLAQSPSCAKLYAAPGNPGIEAYAECVGRSEEHTSELQSLMRISYAVFCLKKKKKKRLKQRTNEKAATNIITVHELNTTER